MMSDYKIKLDEKCQIFKIYHDENYDSLGRFSNKCQFSALSLIGRRAHERHHLETISRYHAK